MKKINNITALTINAKILNRPGINGRLSLLIICIICVYLCNQCYSQTFQKVFGGGQGSFNNKWDYGTSIRQTSDGGYIVAGYSDATGLGLDDVYLVRLDANGDTLWTRIYGGSNKDYARSVWQTNDSGFVICGETQSYGVFKNDIFLLRTDALGNLQWAKTYGGSEEDYGSQVQQTADGGFIIVGRTQSFGVGGGYYDVYLIKTNASGDTLWTKTYGGSSDDEGYSVQQTSDGGYIITGEESSVNYGVLLMKTDGNGDITWTKTIRGNYGGYSGSSVRQTSDGGYIVTGYSTDAGIGSYDIFLFKTDLNGIVSWTKAFGSSSLDEGRSVKQTTDGGYIVVGYSYAGSVYSQFHAIKTDASGNIQWDKAYKSDYGNEGHDVIQTSDGGYAMTGYLYNTFGNTLAGVYQGYDAYIIKTDANGDSPGCVTDSPGLVNSTLTWTYYASSLTIGAGATVTTPTVTESFSMTNIDDAAIKMNFSITNVLCDAVCNGSIAVNTCDSAGFYCSGTAPYNYLWDASTGGQTTPTATGLCEGTYSVTITDFSNCAGVDSAQVTITALPQDICLITVDSTSAKNVIVWEKPITTSIDSFRIYRNIVGNYTHVGSVDYNSLSEFADNTLGVNPQVTSYRYKISAMDTCGNESALSDYHETIHLTVSQGSPPPAKNLIWDNYEGFNFNYYRILRDNTGNGDFEVIDSVTSASTTYTDLYPPSEDVLYIIEVVHLSVCTATMMKHSGFTGQALKAKDYNSSKSNTCSVAGGGTLSATATSTNATPGNCDGTTTVTAYGGLPPYTYQWDGGTGFQTTPTAYGLCTGNYNVTVTDADGNTATSSVTVGEATGYQTLSGFGTLTGFRVFPNPGTGVFTVEGDVEEIGGIRVFNIFGQEVKKVVATGGNVSNSMEIDLSDYHPGIYNLQMITNKGVTNKKIALE
ncbi:MAG: T9SS type A sorting domain-containing protein [Bacteroidota bacterium]